jgi:RHS repeat-associated protein
VGLRPANYTANLLNQYSQRTVPGYVDILGVAFATNLVYVNSQIANRKGEYFWKELSMNNTTGSVWQPVAVTATGLTTVTGNVFVARTPEVFSYDLDGNMTSDGRWNYTWDAENRLVKMESRPDTPSGSWRRIEWTYDALGRRIQQVTSIWTNNAWFVEENLKFVSDPMLFGRHIAELNAPNNALVRSYAWGLDLSETMNSAGGVGGLAWVTLHATSSSASGTHFVCYDGNGNIVALVSAATGDVTARYEYGPFGEPIRVSGPAANLNPFRFSTKRTDPTTDLVVYEYRAYSPTSGRWLSRDPIMEAGSLNLYAFLLNDPIDDVDLFGLMNCQRDRFEFELGKFMKLIPFEGEEKVGDAWIGAEWSRCDKCCKDGVKTRHKWDVAVGASGVGRKLRPFAGIGVPFVYVRIIYSGNGSVSSVKEPCPKSWSGGGCVTVMIGVRVGIDGTIPGWLDVYGEGGGCRICLKASRLEDRSRVTMSCTLYGRAGVCVGVGRFRYTHIWEIQASTDEGDIFSF